MPLTPASSRTVTGSMIPDGTITAAMLASGLALLDELFNSTLGADAATFDTGAGGFATNGRALFVIAQLRTTEAVAISAARVTFNADTGANYDTQFAAGRNATASAGASAAITDFGFVCPGASCAAGVFGAGLILVPNYGGTVAEKSALIFAGHADEAVANSNAQVSQAHWRSTAAISRLIFTAQGGSNFLTGSRVTVYKVG